MQRIDPIKRRDGPEPVRLPLLTPLEREQEREERERRRRARPRAGTPKPAAPAPPADPDDAPPRLDIRV